ncbi:MAG: DUF1294 domain-containing protein [Pseudomonadales bacterium]
MSSSRFGRTDCLERGVIVTWDTQRGFGFAEVTGMEQQVFLHASEFLEQQYLPQVGASVEFQTVRTEKGKLRAKKISFLDSAPTRKPRRGEALALLVVGLFFTLLYLLAAAGKLPLAVVALYLLASFISFVLYALDKARAQRDAWRISERTLQLWSVLGGWPGALVAQSVLRHKTRKTGFIVVFVLGSCFNLAALLWCVMEPQNIFVQQLRQLDASVLQVFYG